MAVLHGQHGHLWTRITGNIQIQCFSGLQDPKEPYSIYMSSLEPCVTRRQSCGYRPCRHSSPECIAAAVSLCAHVLRIADSCYVQYHYNVSHDQWYNTVLGLVRSVFMQIASGIMEQPVPGGVMAQRASILFRSDSFQCCEHAQKYRWVTHAGVS